MKAFRNATLSLAALALVAAVPTAQADSISYSATVPSTETDFGPDALTVNQFHSSLGTLTKVIIQLNGGGNTDFVVTATNPDSPTTLNELDPYVKLELTGLGISGTGVDKLTTSDPNVDLNGPVYVYFGTPYDTGLLSFTDPGYSKSLTSSLSAFIGNGNLTYDLSTYTSLLSDIGGGEYTTGQTTYVDAQLEITYDYTPGSVVPEPGTLIMFGTGLLGLAGMLRYKLHRSR